MEKFSMDIENQKIKSVDRSDFDDEKYKKYDEENKKHTVEQKKLTYEDNKKRESELASLNYKLNENVDKKEMVSEFIRKNCSEPIGSVEKVVSFEKLVKILLKDAQNEVNKADEEIGKSSFLGKLKPWIRKRKNQQVLDSIKKGNAKDKRIYELPAYKSLIEEGFILPSDVRTYYDSANKEPVYHLGVDYNVKAGTEVKSIYGGKVVSSGLDGGLGHKVIIEHTTEKGDKFYSLYGHLGSTNLPTVGSDVKIGDIIGKVGKPFTKENGKWEEHLHFQIMESVDSPRGYSKHEGEGNYDVLKSFGRK